MGEKTNLIIVEVVARCKFIESCLIMIIDHKLPFFFLIYFLHWYCAKFLMIFYFVHFKSL